MKIFFLIIALTAAPDFAQTTTQPIPTTMPVATRPAPAHQLTTLISAAVLKIEHLPPSSDHEERVAAIAAGLKGQRVYGSVIVDSASDGFVNAHLLWHDKPKLTAQEEGSITKDQTDVDKAEAENNAWNAKSSAHSNGKYVPQNNETVQVIAIAKERLKTDKDKVDAAAIARLPKQTVAITTDDPKAASLLLKSTYVVAGVITDATESVDAAGFVSFAVKITAAP